MLMEVLAPTRLMEKRSTSSQSESEELVVRLLGRKEKQ